MEFEIFKFGLNFFVRSSTSNTAHNKKSSRNVINHSACNNKTQMFDYSEQDSKKIDKQKK